MEGSTSRPLVLIVDDESTMLLLTRAALEQAGFEVVEADSGSQALEVFKTMLPDLVLLDVMMPGMDGFATCTELRKLPGGQHTPILMTTALDDLDSINRAFEAGATDFITKPLNWTILSYRVRYMVRASQTFAALHRSQKMEAVGRLAGGVAHDFNNMLTVIAGCSDFLLQHLTGQEELRHEVEEIQQAAERATSLTRQLLAFSRKQVLKPQILDLNSVVASIDKMLLRIIGEDIHLITILEPRLGSVKADPGQIGQVILNLAVNARDAMLQGGRLIIETANFQADDAISRQLDIPPGFYSMLTISDTGMGITPEAQPNIFEPFYTTKDSEEGTGLGLSTVYGIVTQSGGHIRLSSAIDKGTAFKIFLPQVAAPQPEAGLSQSRRLSLQGSETILLVEDEDLVREVTRRILERYGYTLLLARNGPEALRLMETYSGPLDLLLTDVVMPGMSGRELSEHLASRHRHVKVLYISGYTENIIGEPGTLNPGIAFLQKPFKHFELALKVREILNPQTEDYETPGAVAQAVKSDAEA